MYGYTISSLEVFQAGYQGLSWMLGTGSEARHAHACCRHTHAWNHQRTPTTTYTNSTKKKTALQAVLVITPGLGSSAPLSRALQAEQRAQDPVAQFDTVPPYRARRSASRSLQRIPHSHADDQDTIETQVEAQARAAPPSLPLLWPRETFHSWTCSIWHAQASQQQHRAETTTTGVP